MGEYASWVSVRWRKKAALKAFSVRVKRKVTALLPDNFRHHIEVGINANEAASIGESSWEEKASFIDDILSPANLRKSSARDTRPSVVHLIGSLQPGGAERQLCNCAIGQHRLGFDVTVLLLFKPTDEHDHYGEMLSEEGVRVRVVGEHFNSRFGSALKKLPGGENALKSIPEEFCPWAIDVLGEMLTDTPDVFHSWLDHPNIWGGVGALLARVPLVVLSTRNVNPTHFPYLASPYFHAMYSKMARVPNLRFINNSHAGAEDYAEWLELPKEKFSVVLNGVDFSGLRRAANETVAVFKDELGIPPDAKIIAGVFRLSEEKQPILFLEVVRRVINQRQDVYAVVAGIGSYEQEMRDFILAHNLGERVFLLGRRNDIPTIFSAASLKLLCSRQEGTPNVLLEAQWLGCPVVSTKAGGAIDAIQNGETGFLVNVGDTEALEAKVLELFENSALRARFAEQGPSFIRDVFCVDRMVQETISIYNN